MRKIINKTVHYGSLGAKKVLNKSPRVKHVLKRVVLTQMGISSAGTQAYQKWLNNNLPDFIEIAKLRTADTRLSYRPLISVVVPTYNPKPQFLRDCIESVLAQVYDNWELCIVDDASTDGTTRDIIKEYAAGNDRIKYKFLRNNHHIAGATNEAIAISGGEFVALFDHDDLLWPNALHEIVAALNNDKKLDFIYTDEDKITENRHEHLGPFFKPDWNPDFLHSVNYITHFSVVRRSLVDELGGLRSDYNGAQDWDLFLRVTGATERIHHVPKVVYSWRIHAQSTAKTTDSKPYVVAAQKRALEDDLARRGYQDASVSQDPRHPGYWKVRYAMRDDPLVSIVIPSKDQYHVLRRCVSSIYDKSTYQNFEIVLVDTGSTDGRVLRWYKKMTERYSNFKLVDWPEKPFSYVRSCNEGARVANGKVLIMLNNDTEVLTPDWMEAMVSEALRPEVGAVGALLFFPDKYHIQHAGVGVGLGGVAANSFSMMTFQQRMSQTQHLMVHTRHNMTAVTAACMAIRKSVFDEIGGFSEEFRITYNDVDLCLRLVDRGYQNLYTPYARLVHHESISLGLPEEVAKRDTTEFKKAKNLFVTRWKKYVDHDPNINPNLNKADAFYEISK